MTQAPVHPVELALAEQHRHQSELLERLHRQPHVREHLQAGQLRELQSLLHELGRTYVGHQAINHRQLWPAVTRSWPDGRTVRKRLRQRSHDIEHLLVKLRWLGDRDSEIDDVLGQLSEKIRAHQDFESAQLVRLRREADAEELHGVCDQVGHLASPDWRTPTRPHPDLPGWPGAARLVGIPVAVIDRVADALRFRPIGS